MYVCRYVYVLHICILIILISDGFNQELRHEPGGLNTEGILNCLITVYINAVCTCNE